MIKDVKLVICDVDWTLLSRVKRNLDEYTMGVVEELHKRGIKFGIASGRPIEEAKPVVDAWGTSFPFDVIISMNGGQLYIEETKEFHEYYKLKKEWIKEIVQMLEPLNMNPYMYYHDGFIAMKESEAILRSCERNHRKFYLAKDIDDFAKEENGKILVRFPEEQMEMVENYVSQFPSENYMAFKTQRTLMEFTDKRVSKGEALRKYSEISGIPLENILAFGDTTNDNEMLKTAGWGVCLLNGSDDTKAIADDITEVDVEQDGFARYVAKHVLNRE